MLSIITITYNDPAGLRATCSSLEPIKGALDNIGIQWEHIVIDSSPDRSRPVLDGLRGMDWPLVHVIEPARGIYAAMNAGVERASGEWIWLLNGGDQAGGPAGLVGAIERFKSDSSLDLVFGSASRVRAGEFLYTEHPRETFLDSILGLNRICHQAMIYRRSAFSRSGLFSTQYRIAGDYEHHFKCYLAGLKGQRIDAVLALVDVGGISADQWKVALREFAQVGRSIGKKLSLRQAGAFWVQLGLSGTRIYAIKSVRASRLGDSMKPIWLWWKRR